MKSITGSNATQDMILASMGEKKIIMNKNYVARPQKKKKRKREEY